MSGEQVLLDVDILAPFDLPADHYFFVPQVGLDDGSFLWLSAARPIVGGTGPFAPDLQSWIRNDLLAPDWLRIGTDITEAGPFNAAFSLSGETVEGVAPVPLPASGLLLGGLFAAALVRRRGASGSA